MSRPLNFRTALKDLLQLLPFFFLHQILFCLIHNNTSSFLSSTFVQASFNPKTNYNNNANTNAHANRDPSRVIGGTAITPYDKYSFLAGLWYIQNVNTDTNTMTATQVCGATLIAPNVFLSAAHCYDPDKAGSSSNMYLKLGEYNLIDDEDFGVNYFVKRVIVHEAFAERQVHNDIMLIETFDSVDLDLFQMIKLQNFTIAATGMQNATVAGWGRTSEDGDPSVTAILEAKLDVYNAADCEEYLNSAEFVTEFNDFIEYYDASGKLCAGGNGLTDSCYGDSGGPLFYAVELKGNVNIEDESIMSNNTAFNEMDSISEVSSVSYYQVGIVSFGVGCGRYGHPGVYTDVSHYYGWILNNVCGGDYPMSPNYTDLCGTYSNSLPTVSSSLSPTKAPKSGVSYECQVETNTLNQLPILNVAEGQFLDIDEVCTDNDTKCTLDFSSKVSDFADVCLAINGISTSFDFIFDCTEMNNGTKRYEFKYIELTVCHGDSCTYEEMEKAVREIYKGVLEGNDLIDTCTVQTYVSDSSSSTKMLMPLEFFKYFGITILVTSSIISMVTF